MADVKTFLLFFIIPAIDCFIINSKLPEMDNDRSHLEFSHIKEICNNRDIVCKSNDTHICASRLINGKMEYQNFENSCFLFLSNMCDYPGDEYNIIEGISCDAYLRRSINNNNKTESDTIDVTANTTNFENGTVTTEPGILRAEGVSRLYDIDTAFDYHTCPLSCPDTYSPVCVSANRGAGKYFKFYTFINHCQGDVYYCKHFDEFAPPPDAEEEDVNSSGLSWSYCGASRYMQFARFSEVLSSLGHYGWLAGKQRYSHIMEPADRKPGFG